jgi:hypothetical protein
MLVLRFEEAAMNRLAPRLLALACALGFLAAACDDGAGPGDDPAPNPVVDLAVESLSDSSVTLTWTAPRVNGRRAARYEILYSTAADSVDWSTATAVASPPTPSTPGTAEHLTVPGLARLERHQFALRSDDGRNGWSGYSNAVAATIPWTPTSESDLIAKFTEVYRRRDFDLFATLFSTEADSAEFFFFLNEPAGANWDLTEELRIHRRMFKPEDPLPGESPVPLDLWLFRIDIQIAARTAWVERPSLYRSASNPGGLDPARWRAREAQHNAFVFFKMSGQTDYSVDGLENFIVIEDLQRTAGEDRKFLLYRWEDLGSPERISAGVAPAVWTSMKAMYK